MIALPRSQTVKNNFELLKSSPQWVCWKTVKEKDAPEGEKPSKVPMNPRTGGNAKPNNSQTWSTWEHAHRASKKYDGIGYMFLKEQGITGVDLDHCLSEDGTLSPFAQKVVSLLNSYTETSPSGDGLHIWVRGNIPSNLPSVETDDIEMYDHARYFTISGKHWPGTPETFEERQEELLQLHQEIAHRRKQAKLAKPDEKQPVITPTPAQVGDTPYGLSALARECQALAETAQGARNQRLYEAAMKCASLVSGAELTQETVETHLFDAAQASGLDEAEIRSSIESGFKIGIQNPRKAPEKQQQAAADLPEIVIGTQMRETIDAALDALKLSQKDQPTIFVHAGRLVRIGRFEGHMRIFAFTEASLRETLSRVANFYRTQKVPNTDTVRLIDISPPKEIAESILSALPASLPFPILETIIEAPVIRPDGTVLDKAGYDEGTRLYYDKSITMEACQVPTAPTKAEIKNAVATIWDAIGEFAFVSPADKANAFGLLLTPIVRPAIHGCVPLALLDAPKQGSGKGYLASVVSIIATGDIAVNITPETNEAEWKKSLHSVLLEGPTMICIDNVVNKLQSATLDSTLTSPSLKARLLGLSKTAEAPNRATWMATGNNIRVGGDLARRCYRIQQDPGVAKPWMRKGFKHDPLLPWVKENRAHLLSALLTLARAWFVAGKPHYEYLPSLGSFSGWSSLIGGILEHAGISGFLSNLDALYSEVDEDSTSWEAFLEAWQHTFADTWIPTSKLIEIIKADEGGPLAQALPDTLQFALKEKPQSFAIKLGRALEKKIGTCYGDTNLKIERKKDLHTKSKLWRIVAGSSPNNPPQNETALQAKAGRVAGSAESQHTQARYANNPPCSDNESKSQSGERVSNHLQPPAKVVDVPLEPFHAAESSFSTPRKNDDLNEQVQCVWRLVQQQTSVLWAGSLRHTRFRSTGSLDPRLYCERLQELLVSGDASEKAIAEKEIEDRLSL